MSRLLIMVLSIGLIACQQQSDTAADVSADADSAELAASADAPGPRLYVFDCGRIRLVSIEAFNLKETDTDVRELSAPCYVVDHPRGQLLWDAGLPSVFAQTDGWVTREDGVANWLEETLASQMVRMDLGFDVSSLSTSRSRISTGITWAHLMMWRVAPGWFSRAITTPPMPRAI